METMLLDKERAEAFADRMLGVLNDGALAIMLSIGHRTGLFDVMSEMGAAESAEVAAKAGLNERYVREWLGAMVTGGVVEVDPDGPRYSLPPEHAAWLTRASEPNNIAVFAQYIPLMGAVEDAIVDRFRNGGGIAYEDYGRFHDVMAEDSGQTVVSALIGSILPLADGLVERLDSGIDVLDVGCGSGRALVLMAKNFPSSRFTGYDISAEAIAAGKKQAVSLGLENVAFELRDVTGLDMKERFDLITAFDAIHDQARPDRVLAGIYEALRTDGVFLMQDIAASSHVHKNVGHPIGPFLYAISTMHCMPVSLHFDGGMGLGTMWGRERAVEMLRQAGFGSLEVKDLPHDFQNYFYIVRK